MPARGPQPKRLHHMDRLHSLNSPAPKREAPRLAVLTSVLCTTALFTTGCDNDGAEAESQAGAAPPARFEAVTKKSQISEKDLEGFCDLRDAGKFELPAISGDSEPKGARWVNLWATWCKSCVEEMPMIERWKKSSGLQVLYVSADEEPEQLASFLQKHPETPKSATMKDPSSLTAWMKALGLDEGAGLPLHVFVRSDDTVACARAAAVSEHHLPLIKELLK